MEQHEDVIEAGTEFVSQDFQFDSIVDHGQDVLLHHYETFPGEP